MKKLLLIAAVALSAVLAPAAAQAADPYPAGDVPPTSGEPGAQLNFSIQTGQPSTPGTVVVQGDSLNTNAVTSASVTHNLVTGADGLAKFGVLLPANATPGSTYGITLTVGTFVKTLSIAVANAQLATDPLPESPATPTTTTPGGIDPSVWWFGGGALLLLAGGVAVFLIRRNRSKTDTPAS